MSGGEGSDHNHKCDWNIDDLLWMKKSKAPTTARCVIGTFMDCDGGLMRSVLTTILCVIGTLMDRDRELMKRAPTPTRCVIGTLMVRSYHSASRVQSKMASCNRVAYASCSRSESERRRGGGRLQEEGSVNKVVYI